MEAGSTAFVAVVAQPPGTLLLYAAFAMPHRPRAAQALAPAQPAHAGLGAGPGRARLPDPVLAGRSTSSAPAAPISCSGVDDNYAYVLNALWPDGAWRQSLMLILVWLHGCIGMHFWLRLRAWYPARAALAVRARLLLPALALIGFANAGRELRAMALPIRRGSRAMPRPAEVARAGRARLGLSSRALGAARLRACCWRRPSVARAVRALGARYGGRVRLRYPGGVTVSLEPGMSVLEASRAAGMPHASVCGGRGRCSTCRVRRRRGRAASAAAGRRRGARAGPDRRRAGQRPARLPAAADPRSRRGAAAARQRRAAARCRSRSTRARASSARLRSCSRICARSRGWPRAGCPTTSCSCSTSISRPWARRSRAQGGRVDKFMGDGIMALFGVDLGPEAACRQALAGARAMALALERLNQELEPRSARAAPDGHRPARRTGDPGRDGLWPRPGADRDRRYRQRRLKARGADQGGRRAAGGLGRACGARRDRACRLRAARDRDPRSPAPAAASGWSPMPSLLPVGGAAPTRSAAPSWMQLVDRGRRALRPAP